MNSASSFPSLKLLLALSQPPRIVLMGRAREGCWLVAVGDNRFEIILQGKPRGKQSQATEYTSGNPLIYLLSVLFCVKKTMSSGHSFYFFTFLIKSMKRCKKANVGFS